MKSKRKILNCLEHGKTEFFYSSYNKKNRKRKYKIIYCLKCNQEKQKETRNKNKVECLKIIKQYSCEECGYDDNSSSLHFHHKDKTEKIDGISKMLTYKNSTNQDKIKTELLKCEVLCANCHMQKHSVNNWIENTNNLIFSDTAHMGSFIKKIILLKTMGGACLLCQNTEYSHLSFHHIYPKDFQDKNLSKKYNLCLGSFRKKFSKILSEANKTVVLCHNCHSELESGWHKNIENKWKKSYPYQLINEETYKTKYDDLYEELMNSNKIEFTDKQVQKRLEKLKSNGVAYKKASQTTKKEFNCNECNQKVSPNKTICSECYSKSTRKVERPPYLQLLKEIKDSGYSAVGRKYGVSDNAIRKWVRNYEKQAI